ncbi:two-component system response regulator RR class II (RRII)-LuxR [Synechococcus sp. SYN20]|uniref:hypothetical protein n=1 Tax=Synechococcus sp. SYN20 TaxID=1050714 RepID=UPI0016466297|nr:hypothetical protein [Synechococcus sp. SYN20]QNJ27497.1 two-component system response regulator RR class II (RRII)-LuxR [Synechococcus sp. SYN20]
MSNSQRPLSDAKRVLRIKALIHYTDVVVCMYPFAFMFQELAKVIGMDSPKSRHFLRKTRDPERSEAGPVTASGVDL